MVLRPSRDLTAVKADPVCRKEGTLALRLARQAGLKVIRRGLPWKAMYILVSIRVT
jgi:hypothetical protein